MTGTPVGYPHLPTARQLGQAVLVAVFTCVVTFLGGIINDADGLTHVPDWKLAVQAGITAGLALIGWTATTASRRGP